MKRSWMVLALLGILLAVPAVGMAETSAAGTASTSMADSSGMHHGKAAKKSTHKRRHRKPKPAAPADSTRH